MTREFLTKNDLNLQERVLPFKEQLCSETREVTSGVAAFYEIVKQVVAQPAVIGDTEVTLPDIDVMHDYVERSPNPNFTLTLSTHKGITRWGHSLSVPTWCVKGTYGEGLYNGLYNYLSELSLLLIANYNADILAEQVKSIVTENEIDFYIGSGVDFVRNHSIALGISQDILENIGDLLEEISDVTESIRETFNGLPCILECKKRRTEFALKTGIYTMKTPRALLKKAYPRKAISVRNDVGIYEKDGMTSLIECISCSNKELEQWRARFNNACHVVENTNPRTGDFIKAYSSQELETIKSRLNKKGVTYKVLECGDATYKVLIKQYLCYHCLFGPINLDTYTTESVASSSSSLFDY